MGTWAEFAAANAELAAFGTERLHGGVSYLATVRRDGTPRVHPVTPIIGERLFIFMEPSSPKGHDLLRNPAYALHGGVADTAGGAGEFSVRGTARLVEDLVRRAEAVAASPYRPADRYVLFELDVDGAASTVYEGGNPVHRRWGSG